MWPHSAKMPRIGISDPWHLLVGGVPPIPSDHWKSPMAARFYETLYRQERVSDGASFSWASSFSMPRMRSTFALTVSSSLDSSLAFRYAA